MTDKIQEDFQYEGAKAANEKLGKTEQGRHILSGSEGATVLDSYEGAEQLKAENIRDPLTGLFNYGYFVREIEERTKDPKQSISLMWIDLDNFGDTNETVGHEGANDVLKGIARVLVNSVRPNQKGFVARYGGDEFVIVLPGELTEESLKERANRIREAISGTEFRAAGQGFRQTASIGIGIWNGTEKPKEFLERVDGAMYEAKRRGRSLVVEAK